jgi:epoxyqueuosine reductase
MTKNQVSLNSGEWIKHIIKSFISDSPSNTMEDGSNEAAWDDALVGFASGADPIWQQYKEYIGAFHWTPGKSSASTARRKPSRRMI